MGDPGQASNVLASAEVYQQTFLNILFSNSGAIIALTLFIIIICITGLFLFLKAKKSKYTVQSSEQREVQIVNSGNNATNEAQLGAADPVNPTRAGS